MGMPMGSLGVGEDDGDEMSGDVRFIGEEEEI